MKLDSDVYQVCEPNLVYSDGIICIFELGTHLDSVGASRTPVFLHLHTASTFLGRNISSGQ